MQNDLISKLKPAPNTALLISLVKITLCNVPNDLTEVFRNISFILTSCKFFFMANYLFECILKSHKEG